MTTQSQLNNWSIDQTQIIKHVIAHAEPENRQKMKDICIKEMLDSNTPFEQMDEEEKDSFEKEVIMCFNYHSLLTTEIIECEFLEDQELDGTVSVEAKGADGETEETFYVQLLGCKHRPSMDCWVTTNSSNGDVRDFDYPLFCLGTVIAAAEEFAKKRLNPRFYNGYWLIDTLGFVEVYERNNNYLNSDASPYTEDWEEKQGTFESEEDAKAWIDGEDDE